MNVLLVFFAIPLAIIILSVIFERYLRCPLAVAGIFFSIGFVVTFALGAMIEYIVATIVYTILSFVAALITNYIRRRCVENRQILICQRCMQNRNR